MKAMTPPRKRWKEGSMADTIGAEVVITRKNHVCFGCGREFLKGSRMEKSFVTGEAPFSCYLCETCLSITHKMKYWNEFGYGDLRDGALEIENEMKGEKHG